MLAALTELAFLVVPYFLGVCLRHRIEALEAKDRCVAPPRLKAHLVVGVVTFSCTHVTVMFPIASVVLTQLDLSSAETSRSAILTFLFFVVQGFLSLDVATAGRSLVRRVRR